MAWDGPVLDNHLHLNDDTGAGIGAVEDFVAAGGTHLLVVNRPSWGYGVSVDHPSDFAVGFRRTIDLCDRASEVLPGRAWPVLGVHPALISRLTEDGDYSPTAAAELMCRGLDRAGEFVTAGDALAIKSGRPHYDVDEPVWAAANDVLRHALATAADVGCAVQLHTEASEDLREITEWATTAGLDPHAVVKHYADGPVAGPVPSVIARTEAIAAVIDGESSFLLETDFLDDPDRPGAVLGPKTVPRRTDWIATNHGTAPLERAHVDTPADVYGIDTRATLDPDPSPSPDRS